MHPLTQVRVEYHTSPGERKHYYFRNKQEQEAAIKNNLVSQLAEELASIVELEKEEVESGTNYSLTIQVKQA